MVRISDARMSGTAYGTVVLHTSPEAAVGGPLAIVKTGDYIEIDVPNRRLHLDVPDAEIAERLLAWSPTVEAPASGYARLFHQHVEGADTGADFDFLKGSRGREVGKDSH
jgi:dihydroxy-acid dehydratase